MKTPAPRRGRPRKHPEGMDPRRAEIPPTTFGEARGRAEAEIDHKKDVLEHDLPSYEYFWRPVSVNFLANVFRNRDHAYIRSKLADCPVKGYGEDRKPRYDFLEAASYLVSPADVAEHIRRMKAVDLPPALSAAVWKARLDEQKWHTLAGNLWHTEDVLTVFGDVFMLMRTRMQLWVETLNDKLTLTPEQFELIRNLVDGLQQEMHDALVKLPAQKSTPSSLAESSKVDDPEIEDMI